jgi:hypothetical protein
MNNGHTTWIIGIMCSDYILVYRSHRTLRSPVMERYQYDPFPVFLLNNLLLRS